MRSIWSSLNTTEFQLKFYDAKGVRTRCLEAGAGEAIIFLHGVGGHLEAFSRNVAVLANNGFRVLCIDMIGHGYTDKVTDRDLELPDYTKHLRDFMDAAGVEKATITGESLGGWVAAWFAWEYPDRVNKIILNTAGGLTAYPEGMKRLKTLTLEAVKNASYESVKKRLEFLMYDPASVTEELVDIRLGIYRQPDMFQSVERIMCLQEMEVRQRNMLTEDILTKIKAPTCVVWTTHDPTAPPEIGQKFADYIPTSEFHVIENSGHWPQYESYEEYNEITFKFLKKKY